MDKKAEKKEDCKICYGCGGCEDYGKKTELNELYAMYETGAPETPPEKNTEEGKKNEEKKQGS